MGYAVTLYTLNKRKNSTKDSGATGAVSCTCTLIDDTDLMHPTFKLELGINPVNKNYCVIPEFGRKYFIEKVRSYQGFWYIECECDVLGTYKTDIGQQTHYVLRSASSYDGTISDNVYPATTRFETFKDVPTGDDSDPLKWSDGYCYILGIVGSTNEAVSQIGSIVYYALNPYALTTFIRWLMNNVDTWGSIAQSDYSLGVQKALLNPIQYIKSCICMPFSVEQISGDKRGFIYFGYYQYAVPNDNFTTVKIITDEKIVKTKENTKIAVRNHPQAATRGSYLNCQPFTSRTLHFGPWGDIELDPMMVNGDIYIKLETLYDLITGVGRLKVTGFADITDIYYCGCTKIGVDINLSQVYKDALGYEKATTNTLFGSIAAGAGLGMSNNPIQSLASGLSFITSGVQDMTRLNYPTVSGVGNNGSFLAFKDPDNLYLLSKFNYVVDEDLAEIGRPLCQSVQISTLSGYILCQNADVSINCTKEEADKINQYLNSGFFYE